MKFRMMALAVSTAILLLSGLSFGQAVGAGRVSTNSVGGMYAISGKVFMPDGRPAVGARVSVSSNESVNPSTTTDVDGNYYFGGFPAGNYTVIALVEGLASQSESQTIYPDRPAGQTIYIPIFLRNPSQKKGDFYSANPMFADVPSAALEKYKLAFDKIIKDDWKGAAPLLDQAIEAHPEFAVAWYQKGYAAFKSNQFKDAIVAFVKAIEIKPDYLDAKYHFGVVHFAQGNYPVAEAVFRDVIQQKADMPAAHMYLGISLISLKKNDEAEKELKQALALKGGENLALAHRFLGGIYAQKKQKADAISELEKYLQLSPRASDADKIKAMIADLKKQG